MTGVLVHGTTVAVDGAGVLLRGPSGAGKSDLALRLVDGGAELVADDQTRLVARDSMLVASPGPNLAGLLEVRGLGILAVPYRAEVPVRLVVDLVPPEAVERLPEPAVETLLGVSVPRLALDPRPASAAAKVRLAVRQAGCDKMQPP